jgi:hypothetical protein
MISQHLSFFSTRPLLKLIHILPKEFLLYKSILHYILLDTICYLFEII